MKTFIILLILLGLTPVIAPHGAAQETTAPPQWDGTYRRMRVPILMYHYVSELPEDADEYRTELTVLPGVFRAHMEYLFYGGYNPISLYRLDEALMRGTALPPKPVVLTFDDGYIDHYTTVFPILRQYNFTGTFFVITGRADNNDPNHLNWEQIREMADAGMSMESHTKNHVELDGRDYNFLVYEMLGSLESLRHYIGQATHMFSYPVGRYDVETLRVLDTLPVWRAVTTENGALHTSDNRLLMPRVRISNSVGVNALAGLLQGS